MQNGNYQINYVANKRDINNEELMHKMHLNKYLEHIAQCLNMFEPIMTYNVNSRVGDIRQNGKIKQSTKVAILKTREYSL